MFSHLHLMQLFSAEKTTFSKEKKIAPENMEKPPSKVAHHRLNFFFSIANRPKTSPNVRYFS